MNSIRERLIHLHHCRGIGWKSIYKIVQADPTLSSIYNSSSEYFDKLLPNSKNQLKFFLKDLHSSSFLSMLKQYNEKDIKIITILDSAYPNQLKQIYDPPWVLYVKGNEKLLEKENMISIVGTRYPTKYGYTCMERLLPPLVTKNFIIVSGLAKGIDTYAHQLAIKNHGHTIAVIAGGFHNIYPRENLELAYVIEKDHLLISEYPPYMRPEKWQFPMRNRIISGLSLGTIVIEAKERSGSLITADQALNQGREVFALPGSILEETSSGTNKLIQNGAKLITSSQDIIDELMYLINFKNGMNYKKS